MAEKSVFLFLVLFEERRSRGAFDSVQRKQEHLPLFDQRETLNTRTYDIPFEDQIPRKTELALSSYVKEFPVVQSKERREDIVDPERPLR